MLNPDFPNQLLKTGHWHTIEFIHFLFKDYLKCDLIKKTDRAITISRLEARIADTLKFSNSYIFAASVIIRLF